MILDTLTLYNFRQFYGTQHIYFSRDRGRNVTVIHGENGAGKTALLNAFIWCLYGETNLPEPTEIICERAVFEAAPGSELRAYVTLRFERDLKRYTATREVKARKQYDGSIEYFEATLDLEYVDETGRAKSIKNPQDAIQQMIPVDLRGYFFFDGERIDYLTRKEGAGDIKRAVKVLMGLEILERASKHLPVVQRRFRDEVAAVGDKGIQELNEAINELEARKTETLKLIDEEKKNAEALRTMINDVRERLRSLEASQELQRQRDALHEAERQTQKEISDINRELVEIISKRGYLAYARRIIGEVGAFLEEKRQKAEIPTGIKRQFVDDLLESGMCICRRPLTEGTEWYGHVLNWRNRSTSKELEDAYINMTGHIKVLQREVPQLFTDLDRLLDRKEKARARLLEIQEELSEVTSQLEGKDEEEVSQLARKEREYEVKLDETNKKIGALERDLESISECIQDKSADLKRRSAVLEKAELARRRLEACERVRAVIDQILAVQSDEVQQRLQSKITEVLSRLLRKGYEAVIDEGYSLTVVKPMGGTFTPVLMSQGERQVTSLSFIGAVVDIAREQHEKGSPQDSPYFRGGYYPLVMDSPFGTMDHDHRRRTAEGIPSLAHQVVVMVSSSQWDGAVEQGMRNAVGREYWLHNFPPTSGGQTRYEYTEIREEPYHA